MTKKQLQEFLKKHKWNSLETKDGFAWFGGKSHYTLAEAINLKDDETLQDIDFLVCGFRRSNEGEDDD